VNRVELVHNQEIISGTGDIAQILSPYYARALAAIQPIQVIQMIQTSLDVHQDV